MKNRQTSSAVALGMICLSLFCAPRPGNAEPTYFVVSEIPDTAVYGDSYILPLEDPADIEHARNLIANGPDAGLSIVVADIARGRNGINRNVLATGKPVWSWHITEFLGFTDNTIEIYDGWPTFVEGDVEGWFDNTDGRIGFWGYTVTAEVGQPSSFHINEGLNDAWVNPDAPFQGLFFTVSPQAGLFFVGMFTFDSVLPDPVTDPVLGARDTRWVTGVGSFSGNSVNINMELTTGGVFNAATPVASQSPGYGTATITFQDCNNAVMAYQFPAANLSGQMTLTRALPRSVVLCEVLTAP